MSPPLSLSSPTSIILEAALSSSSGTGTEQHNHKVSPQNDDRLTSMPTTDTYVDPRSCILRIGAQAGKLCQLGLTMTTPKTKAQLNTFGGKKLFDDQDDQDQDDTTTNSSELMDTMTALFIGLWNLSSSLQLNWIDSVRSKMVLNAKKYPIEHCKGKSGKYTEYSHLTGITTTNQSTVDDSSFEDVDNNDSGRCRSITLHEFVDNVDGLCKDIQHFAEDRDWARYHKPRNLIIALFGEAGELAELLQWDDDDDDGDHTTDPTSVDNVDESFEMIEAVALAEKLQLPENAEKLDKLSQEMADVTIYGLRFITVCNIIAPFKESLVSHLEQQQEQQQQLEEGQHA